MIAELAEAGIEGTRIEVEAPMYLPSAVSSEIAAMVEKVRPSVVQVRTRGRGAGAGIIWRADGAVLTNYHVVADGDAPVNVLLPDGREYDAEVVNFNPTLDLALLKLNAEDLPAALVADSTRLRVGELVFAYGHPWGQRDVVTAGIVSGLGTVPIPGSGGREAQYLRSDVKVAPGNSGGPMLDAYGAVVGITAMIFGGDMAVGIPSHVATKWVAGLPSRRLYLGVGLQQVLLPRSEKAERETGLMVVAVEPDGPAHRAGLLIGDVLVAASENPLYEPDMLLSAMSTASDGAMRLRLLRGGITREVDVDLASLEQDA
ncbi:MAG TPA: trypsin-like peptidase domain-containing protein [Chloroflexia bacterium]|nr:trypsin-like peptidase domain-containing protein [Chloroflexia bacterium]